jgi:Phage portal protein, lambda family
MPKGKVYGHGAEPEEKRIKPWSRVNPPEGQDFEQEFECIKPAEEVLKRTRIDLTESKDRKAPNVSGYFCTVERAEKGFKVKVNKVKNTEGFKQFLKSKGYKESRLLESDPFATGTDILTSNPLQSSPNDEYTPIIGGPFSKQLYIFDYLDMHSKVFWYLKHMPLAKQIVDLISFFTIGRGVKLTWKNSELQDAWDAFVERSKFNQFIRMDSDTLTWAGEFMTHKVIINGFPALKHIDPSTVWEIITDPRDIETVFYYHQQFPTQWQLVYKSGDKASEYVVNDIPAEEIIHYKINVVPGEKRGRSDLFSVLGYLKRLRNFLDAKVIKAQIEASWVLRRKVQGSQADVDALAQDPNNNQIPPPGSQMWENEAITTEFIGAATSGNRGEDGMLTDLKAIIATGVGLSPEYLGAGGMGQARATAITKSEPAARKFEDRQTLLEGYVREIADWWLEKEPGLPTFQVNKATMGLLKQYLLARDFKGLLRVVGAMIVSIGANLQEPVNKSYEVTFPEIDSGDRADKIQMISIMEAAKDISHETAANLRAKELNITSYDFDEEQEKIQEEQVEGTGSVGLDPALTADAGTGAGKAAGTSQGDANFAGGQQEQ